MPVRKSRHDPKIGNITGWFPSRKMRRAIPFESYLEVCCIMILEFLLVVLEFEAQPFTTTYKPLNGKRSKKYTPDIQAKILNASIPAVIEIKPEALIDYEYYMPIKEVIETDLNKTFLFMTDTAIRNEHLLDNIFDLHYHARYDIKPHVQEAYEDILADRVLSIGELALQISSGEPETCISSILRLMWDRKIACNIQSSSPFTSESTIWLTTKSQEIERDFNVYTQICSP